MADTKVAVAGCGHWGRNLLRNFAELGALACVVDTDPSAARAEAEKYNVRALRFDEALAQADIEGIVIAAPAEQHAALTIQALAAGKHVFVEKPIALSVVDGERMRDAAIKAGKTLMVGHLLQYHPAFVTLLAMVRGGDLGTLRYAYSNRLGLGRFRTSENALWSLAPHDVSMLLALFGEEPRVVRGEGTAHVIGGIEDECRIDMDFGGGRRAHVFVSWLHPFKEQRLVVVGDKAMAVFEDSPKNPTLKLYRHIIDMSKPIPTSKMTDPTPIEFAATEPLRNECEHFLACCQGETPRTNAEEALRVLKVLMAASPLKS